MHVKPVEAIYVSPLAGQWKYDTNQDRHAKQHQVPVGHSMQLVAGGILSNTMAQSTDDEELNGPDDGHGRVNRIQGRDGKCQSEAPDSEEKGTPSPPARRTGNLADQKPGYESVYTDLQQNGCVGAARQALCYVSPSDLVVARHHHGERQ